MKYDKTYFENRGGFYDGNEYILIKGFDKSTWTQPQYFDDTLQLDGVSFSE